MTDQEISRMLDSDNPDVILDALFALGGRTSDVPSAELLGRASAFFFHPDADVRRQAVVSVAIHWGHRAAFNGLTKLLETEVDTATADALVSAVALIGRDTPELRAPALSTLKSVALNHAQPRRLRHLAFIEARWMCGQSNPAEHAKEGLDPELVPIDVNWLERAR